MRVLYGRNPLQQIALGKGTCAIISTPPLTPDPVFPFVQPTTLVRSLKSLVLRTNAAGLEAVRKM